MKHLVVFLVFLPVSFGVMEICSHFSHAQTAQGIDSASPPSQGGLSAPPPEGGVQHEKPRDVELIYSNTGAKVAFLIFIFIFFGLYYFITRQPNTKHRKKKKKGR